ncbi:MAG: sigma-70 family RNA polymerase sigma factor [Pyrinomonadaceae bacterium]|nr:sigma-70 family RNA polymerase sigma factor [Pyrinomonadaceae bacterium]
MMLKPRPVATSHEDIFIERYAELRSWALRLTEKDQEKAEDIVQEAFIHFTVARPDINSITNLEGYLYNVLRNLHLSQERRASRSRLQQLSVFEYDTIELALRVVGSIEQLQVQEDLRRVCHYSCVRKETARAASILILRFFHGYYPSEIARVVKTNRRAVDERLRIARNEARFYLDDPTRLRFINGAPPEITEARSIQGTGDFLSELRRMIFNSREGDCLERAELERIYKRDDAAQLSVKQLAHIVSCRACLETVNSLLGLSSLNERHPPDMIGKDSAPKGKGARGRDKRGGDEHFNKYRRRAREVYEHRPQELYFLVNGFILGSQRINSELTEQTLDISIAEGVGFVEVCSEQDVRLFFLNVEPPPAGAVRQPTRVELSDGRSLELTLSFDNKWPTLHTTYHDPLMKAEALAEELSEELTGQAAVDEARRPVNTQEADAHVGFAAFLKDAWRRFVGTRLRLWPGLVTAALALLLIGALVFLKMRAPETNAASLLQSSIAAEEKRSGNAEMVFHRRLRFEEWGDNGTRLIARNRIEVWQSAARELTARRVYDEQGNLIAGEWIRTNGTSTVYQHGDEPQERAAPSLVAKALLETGELWRLEASAKDFSALVGNSAGLSVREEAGAYVIEMSRAQRSDSVSLVSASLTLRQSDLRAIGQKLVIEREGSRHEYRFGEELFEKYPKSHVGRSFFIPDAELNSPSDRKETDKPKAQDGLKDSTSPAPEASSAVASPELEIEVTYLLNRIKANLGEQVSMARTAGGQLRVEALVESEGRKEEILRALSPIINNPAVRVEVATIGEAVRNQQDKSRKPNVTEREVVVPNNRIPAYAELRAYFSGRVVGDAAVEEEIDRYSNRVMNRSRQALLHASALKRLAGRFSAEELQALAPEARAKWIAMVREHALAYQREVSALRQELRSVFGGVDDAAPEALKETDIRQASERLLQLSYMNDEAVRSAFTISAGGGSNSSASAIKSRAFWRQLITAERLAITIQGAYQK